MSRLICFNCHEPVHKDRDGVWVHPDGSGFCPFILGGDVAAAPVYDYPTERNPNEQDH